MAKVYNWVTQQEEEKPDDVATQLVAEGTHTLPRGQIDVVTPSGKYAQIDAEEAGEYFKGGFRIETAAERKQRQLKAEFGDQALLAGTAGAARALSFGLTDVALTKSGIVAPETLEALRTYNPEASMAGEAIATVGSILASGGLSALGTTGRAATTGARVASAAGTAARVATAPVRGVTALAQNVELQVGKALVNALGSKASGSAGKAAARGIAGIVEGSIYGAGQGITEASLNAGNTDKTAEQVLMDISLSALTGGALGGALGSAGSLLGDAVVGGAKLTGKEVKKLWNSTHEARDAITEKTADKLAGLAAAASGNEKADVLEMWKNRKALIKGDKAREPIKSEFVSLTDESEKASRALFSETTGELKADRVRQVIKKGNEEEVADGAMGLMGRVRAQVESMLEEKETYGLRGKSKRIVNLMDEYENRLRKISESNAKDKNTQVFMAMDEFKRKGATLMSPGKYLSSADQEGALVLRDLYRKELMPFLENKKMFGKAAVMQKRINAKWHGFLSTEKSFSNTFMTQHGQEGFDPVFRANPKRFGVYLDNIGTANFGLEDEAVRSHFRSQLELAEEMANFYYFDPSKIHHLDTLRNNAKRALELMDEAESSVGLLNKAKEMIAGESFAGTYIGSEIGQALTGSIGLGGAAGGVVAGALTKPVTTIKHLAQLEVLSSRSTKYISGAVKKFGDIASNRARRARPTVVPGVLTILNGASYGDKKSAPKSSREEAMAARIEELSKAAANPQMMTEKITARIGSMGVSAPKVAQALSMKATQAIVFLAEKAPKNPIQTNPLIKKKWVPPASEIDRFSRYVEVVENPKAVLDHLSNHTLTREHVEAVKTVYPQLYQDIQEQIVDTMVSQQESDNQMSYRDRIQLGILFDVPTDATIDPQFIGRMQAMLSGGAGQGREAQQQTGLDQVSTAGIAKMTLPNRLETPAQKLQG